MILNQVERGMSWEAAEQKKEEAAQDENEGYWLSMQVATRLCFRKLDQFWVEFECHLMAEHAGLN